MLNFKMFITMKKYIILLFAFAIVSSCSDLTDLNTDSKNPTVVPAKNLVSNATVELFDFMSSTNVNENNLRLWAQHWAQVSYSDESNFELTERSVHERTFRTLYSTVIRDVRDAAVLINDDTFISDENKANQLAIIDVIEVTAMSILVDIFGDVPYSEALDSDNVTPAYDNDADIYTELFSKLNAAIAALNGSAGDAGDLIYGGNASAWKKYANSLKLKMAIRISDVDPGTGKSMAESAISSGVFTSDADNFSISYEGSTPNTNPLWEDLVESGRSDFVSANTLVDYMNALNDPRRSTFFKPNVKDANDDVIYVGGTAGDVNSFSASSQVSEWFHQASFPGTLMSYTEVLFLLADAAERGYAAGGTGEEFYNAGVTNSIGEWGGGDASAYLAQTDVAYATAPGNWKEKIALQKWIAMYNNGFEAWSTFRLYDAPTMNLAVAAQTVPPNRYTYPTNEYSVNGANVQAASSAMGGDDLFSKVFWDQ